MKTVENKGRSSVAMSQSMTVRVEQNERRSAHFKVGLTHLNDSLMSSEHPGVDDHRGLQDSPQLHIDEGPIPMFET